MFSFHGQDRRSKTRSGFWSWRQKVANHANAYLTEFPWVCESRRLVKTQSDSLFLVLELCLHAIQSNISFCGMCTSDLYCQVKAEISCKHMLRGQNNLNDERTVWVASTEIEVLHRWHKRNGLLPGIYEVSLCSKKVEYLFDCASVQQCKPSVNTVCWAWQAEVWSCSGQLLCSGLFLFQLSKVSWPDLVSLIPQL